MKKAIRYSVAVCLFSWAVMAGAHWGFDIDPVKTPVGFTALATVCMFFPMLTALVLQAIDKEKFNKAGLVNFKVSWAWLEVWLLPVAMVLLCIFVNGLMPGVELQYNAEQLISQQNIPEDQQELVREQLGLLPAWVMALSSVFSALIAGITINALFAFGEEYGWRCYLVEALKGQKFWKAALFIGIVWGLWHFPIILMGYNYPNESRWGVLLMTIMCILLGIIELYFVLKTKSMIVAAIIHGTFNAMAGMTMLFTLGGNDFLNGMTGLSGFIVMVLTILCIWIYDKHIAKENLCSMTLGEAVSRPAVPCPVSKEEAE